MAHRIEPDHIVDNLTRLFQLHFPGKEGYVIGFERTDYTQWTTIFIRKGKRLYRYPFNKHLSEMFKGDLETQFRDVIKLAKEYFNKGTEKDGREENIEGSSE